MPLQVSLSELPRGPVRRLFEELHALYQDAGEPALRSLGKSMGYSHETVRKSLKGPKVPRWGLLELAIEQLSATSGRQVGETIRDFKVLWRAARTAEDAVHNHETAGLGHDDSSSRIKRTGPSAGGNSRGSSFQVRATRQSHYGAHPGSPLSQAFDGGASVIRVRIGRALRSFREDAGESRAAAALALEIAESKLRRIESGTVRVTMRDARDLMDFYRVATSSASEVLRWVESSRADPWWSDILPLASDVTAYQLSLEGEANLRTFSSTQIPALLQTEAYARYAVESADRSYTSAQIDDIVALRIERQRQLSGYSATSRSSQLDVILDESAVRRGAGNIMRDQCKFLLEIAEWPNVQLRMLPLNSGLYPAHGDFTVYEPFEPLDQAVVVLERVGRNSFEVDAGVVNWYLERWYLLKDLAMGHRDSVAMVQYLS